MGVDESRVRRAGKSRNRMKRKRTQEVLAFRARFTEIERNPSQVRDKV